MLVPLLLLACQLSLAIRVPVSWDSASEVTPSDNNEQFSVESVQPQTVSQNVDSQNKPIPLDYFQYTAKKPQFAVDIAKFHGVQSPENHYKAYPIEPYTGQAKPELGKHHLLDPKNTIHQPLQEFASINEGVPNHAVPVSSNYEVFHPYEAETPALQEIYKDPVLTKIRNDLENSKNRLQAYEKDAGEPDIHKDEYLEPPAKTDNRFVPHKNIPAPYEIHRPQRRPVYYRPVYKNPHREQYLNQRLRHPWNQYSAKIRPMHYKPIKNHIHQLRQNHALKFDDARNEYPQVQIMENYSSDPKDGYDIYERGKDKFEKLRNNVDESINKAVKENRPATYEKLEMQNNDNKNEEDEEEFVPIKNYAQVRKSETYKHLPRQAAFADAESFDEIRNAPRLREAVKSTKAQTVYSEEGYEDTAYDHAGEQKHASENEAHGGFLKENEFSGGKYKTPSESAKYEDGGGSAFRDQVLHAEKWKDDKKNDQEEAHEEDFSEDEQEHSVEADGFETPENEDNTHRNKREDNLLNDTISGKSDAIEGNLTSSAPHEIEKRHSNFQVPELNLNSTFLTEAEILKLGKIKIEPKKNDIKQKYPYYFKKLRAISKHSPLRYAENLKNIPKKSNGGTEFYDSRSAFECPEVDDIPDPVPDKLKGEGHPDENDDEGEEDKSKKGDENYDTAKKTPRLKGLGDKIDCFKAKYFGENPLDSPFFKEDIILDPEPVTLPNSDIYKLKTNSDLKNVGSDIVIGTVAENKSKLIEPDLFDILEKVRNNKNILPNLSYKSKADSQSISQSNDNLNNTHSQLNQQNVLYSDILENIRNNSKKETVLLNQSHPNQATLLNTTHNQLKDNVTYYHFQNPEDITKPPRLLRRKRSTSFVYEPYKIIRDSQVQDSKKTTTTSNISPLIRQLQSSRIVDRVPKLSQDADKSDNPVKRNVNSRTYKDIGKKDRETTGSKNDKGVIADSTIVDISLDRRRGEPRYEVRHANHKSRYTPVENKRSLSVGDYKAQTNTDRNQRVREDSQNLRQFRQRNVSGKGSPNLDVQNEAASSNNIQNTISTTTAVPKDIKSVKNHRVDDNDDDDDYEEYDDDEDEENEEEISTTTTTTTQKPSFRRRMRSSTTTERITILSTEKPRLKLVTRFRNYNPDKEDIEDAQEKSHLKSDKSNINNNQDPIQKSVPKYREKKRKSTKSTLVTDTKRYGDDDHDMRKEEVDALIGVKEDMSDYMPLYEKEEDEKLRRAESSKSESDEDDDDEYESDDTEEDDDDEESNDDDDEEEEDEDEDIEDEKERESNEPKPQVTTPEPTKRTLALTTDAPIPTVASRIMKPESKPIVTRKKIEIHKELPVNKSAPHVTQFKQDIKEVEIVKEIPKLPKRKPQKNLEALQLYKDDNLAKDVNKLGGVEVFKEDLDLKNGPKHGGNYRSLEEPSTPKLVKQGRKRTTKEDAEASQSEFTKHIELDEEVPRRNQMHGGNLRSIGDAPQSRSRGRSSKLIDASSSPVPMHGGNLKHRGRGNSGRSQKLIEFNDEDHTENDPSNDHESFSHSGNSGPMHGGNYRSEQLVVTDKPKVAPRSRSPSARKTSAAILSSFVQAVPILTSTPAYILDPSKRMYYYVDA